MSESDSDLDFESADEETEHDSSEKIDIRESSSAEKEQNSSEKMSGEINANSMGENLSGSVNNLTPASKKDVCDNSQISQPVTSRVVNNTNNKNNENTQPTKQRVTLRLEKKLAQKSQVSNESCPESKEADHSHSAVSDEKKEVKASSWGFSSWSSSLLSTAASSVSTFTSQVSQGIGTVLESVENTLGAPPPEELAETLNKKASLEEPLAEEQILLCNQNEQNEETAEPLSENVENRASLLPNVSYFTKVLENTGSKVLMGGLDTLELIGKKTMDILTEGDPGLRRKRAAFADGITLSQILREAKAEADEQQESSCNDDNFIHYSQMFDEYQGLVHLEALEMLSKQAQAKVQRLIICSKSVEVKKNLEEIKNICENLPTFDDPTDSEKFQDFEAVFKKHALELNLPFNTDSIVKAQARINKEICKYEHSEENSSTAEEIYRLAICNLAEFTAKCIETFHKLAELILVQSSLDPNAEQCAIHLTGLTTVMCIEVNNMSIRYHNCLDTLNVLKEQPIAQKTDVTVIITNLYVEAANSNKYIQDAYQLLIPILQVSLLEAAE